MSRNSFELCLCIAAERENSQLLRPSDIVNSETEDFDNGLQLVRIFSFYVASKCLPQRRKEFAVLCLTASNVDLRVKSQLWPIICVGIICVCGSKLSRRIGCGVSGCLV